MTPISTPDLNLSIDQICFIIVKAREFDVKEGETDAGSASNPTDDNEIDVLEADGNDPVEYELTSFINAMDDDEQIDLVTLMWLGRGDGTAADWATIRSEAANAHNDETARYLLGTPLLGDYLAEGIDKIGLSCTDLM